MQIVFIMNKKLYSTSLLLKAWRCLGTTGGYLGHGRTGYTQQSTTSLVHVMQFMTCDTSP